MAQKQVFNRVNFSSPLYNEATVHNGTVYCSGKIGLDLKTGNLVGDDAGEQTKAAIKLLELVLRTVGSDLTKILKCHVFLTDIRDLPSMNAAYTAMMPDPKPSRVCVTVSELGRGAKVEIDCIAALEDTTPSRL